MLENKGLLLYPIYANNKVQLNENWSNVFEYLPVNWLCISGLEKLS